MSDNNVVLIIAILRLICCGIALLSALYLAFNDKNGWGWFLFVAVVLGGIGIKSTSDIQ